MKMCNNSRFSKYINMNHCEHSVHWRRIFLHLKSSHRIS